MKFLFIISVGLLCHAAKGWSATGGKIFHFEGANYQTDNPQTQAGTKWLDTSGNNKHAISPPAQPFAATGYYPKKEGDVVHFDTQDDYLVILPGIDSIKQNDPRTLCFTRTAQIEACKSKEWGHQIVFGAADYGIGVHQDSVSLFNFGQKKYAIQGGLSGEHTICVTYDGTSTKIFVDTFATPKHTISSGTYQFNWPVKGNVNGVWSTWIGGNGVRWSRGFCTPFPKPFGTCFQFRQQLPCRCMQFSCRGRKSRLYYPQRCRS